MASPKPPGRAIRNAYRWARTDSSLALLHQGDTLWQLNYGTQAGKPYFHPIRPLGGPVLTWLRPPDHPWHRGLWFSWKFINGVNYWEEDRATGRSEGTSRIVNARVELHSDFSATIQLNLAYAPGKDAAVLTERRLLRVSAPAGDGSYSIDWKLDFTVGNQPVRLDCTPPLKKGGPVYGGYAGLSYRAAPSLHRYHYIDSGGWENATNLIGQGNRADWMDLSAVPDSTRPVGAGLAIFNHPRNAVSPTPWYIYQDHDFAFFNAALLFDSPLVWSAHQRHTLRYRVVIHNQLGTKPALDNRYAAFLRTNFQP